MDKVSEIILTKGGDLGPTKKWKRREFVGFRQDVRDWTDEATGKVYPASFGWIGTITGCRAKASPLQDNYYVRVNVPGKEGEPLNLEAARLAFDIGLVKFDQFADCGCSVTGNCERHKMPKGLGWQ